MWNKLFPDLLWYKRTPLGSECTLEEQVAIIVPCWFIEMQEMSCWWALIRISVAAFSGDTVATKSCVSDATITLQLSVNTALATVAHHDLHGTFLRAREGHQLTIHTRTHLTQTCISR